MQSYNDIRVVDPVWSDMAQGYFNGERVGHLLFPSVPVTTRTGTVIRYGREAFQVGDNRRAPGARVLETSYGRGKTSYALEQRAEALRIPIEHVEEADASEPGIDLVQDQMDQHLDKQSLVAEWEMATQAMDPTNYAAGHVINTGAADAWNATTSDPKAQIRIYREMVARKIGRMPNVLVLGVQAFNDLAEHPEVVERFKYTSRESLTVDMLAAFLEVPTIAVGRAVHDAGGAEGLYLWGEDSAVLAYVPNGMEAPMALSNQSLEGGQPDARLVRTGANAGAITTPTGASTGSFQAGQMVGANSRRFYNRRTMSFGYTYRLGGYPIVEGAYYDRATRSWYYNYVDEREPLFTTVDPTSGGSIAGVLLQNLNQ